MHVGLGVWGAIPGRPGMDMLRASHRKRKRELELQNLQVTAPRPRQGARQAGRKKEKQEKH